MKIHFATMYLMSALLAAFIPSVYGQNLTRDAVLNIKIKDTGVIYQQKNVKGYYFFYTLEKTSSKISNYLLTVVDENLNEINSTTITRPATYTLLESAFNGSAFAFLFYDKKKTVLELVTYNIDLKNPKVVPIKVAGKKAVEYYHAVAFSNISDQRFLASIEGRGFIYYSRKGKKATNFAIEYYDNNLNKIWEKNSPPDKKSSILETASEAFQQWPYAGSIVSHTKGKDMNYDLIVHDVSTGETVYQTGLSTTQFDITPTDVRYDSMTRECQVFGEYYFKELDTEMNSQSRGFCNLSLTKDGKPENFKAVSWDKIIVDKTGKADEINTHILFHDFIRTADGQVFAIGEQYKKAVSGEGVGLTAISLLAAAATGAYVSSHMTQMNVYNLVVLQFNPSYEMEKVHIFKKSKTTVQLPSGSMYVSPKSLTYLVKAMGGFDFRFSQMFPDQNTFACVYTDFEQQQARGVMGTVVYTPEKTFAEDKMYINRRTVNFALWPAKPGYILVLEYMKKEKKLDMRLEKINY